MANIIICDLCNKQISNDDEFEYQLVKRNKHNYFSLDLCEECHNKIMLMHSKKTDKREE